MEVIHHFNIYAKETHISAGEEIKQHAHPYAHLSALTKGTAIVSADGSSRSHTAPVLISMPAKVEHSVLAITDVIWFCIHKTDEKDPDKVDQAILNG